MDYHSKFPDNEEDGWVISTESHHNSKNHICWIWYTACRLTSDPHSNFISEKFRSFYSSLNTEQAVSSLYHHQSNRQVEACIKSIKHTIKMLRLHGGDVYMELLQIRTTPLRWGLPSPATLPFNHLVHSIMPVLDRKPVSIDNDDEHP